MRLGKALTDSVILPHDDFEWIQPIDYEHVPFRCRKCHAHSHLFRDCPLNAAPKPTEHSEKSDSEGFTKVTNRKKHTKKPPHGPKTPCPPSLYHPPVTSLIFYHTKICQNQICPKWLSQPPCQPPSHPPHLNPMTPVRLCRQKNQINSQKLLNPPPSKRKTQSYGQRKEWTLKIF